MAKVITFSRTYPSYHPKAGQSTGFIEKIWESIAYMDYIYAEQFPIPYEAVQWDRTVQGAKHHTIRAGHRWKAGDWFTPKVWGNDINPKSGRSGPYHSKQIQFTPDIQVKKVWDLDIEGSDWFVNGKRESPIIGEGFNSELLAMNDGLSGDDLYHWFVDSPEFKKKQVFSGQIICWNENIEY